MNRDIVLRLEAAHDLLQARSYYESRRCGLGDLPQRYRLRHETDEGGRFDVSRTIESPNPRSKYLPSCMAAGIQVRGTAGLVRND